MSDVFVFLSGISITGTQFVEKGASIHLVCNVTSKNTPPQSVDWFKDGSPLQTSYSREIYIQQSVSIASKKIVSAVDIARARMSDTGVYVCRASDKLATRIKVDVLNGKSNYCTNTQPATLVVIQTDSYLNRSLLLNENELYETYRHTNVFFIIKSCDSNKGLFFPPIVTYNRIS